MSIVVAVRTRNPCLRLSESHRLFVGTSGPAKIDRTHSEWLIPIPSFQILPKATEVTISRDKDHTDSCKPLMTHNTPQSSSHEKADEYSPKSRQLPTMDLITEDTLQNLQDKLAEFTRKMSQMTIKDTVTSSSATKQSRFEFKPKGATATSATGKNSTSQTTALKRPHEESYTNKEFSNSKKSRIDDR